MQRVRKSLQFDAGSHRIMVAGMQTVNPVVDDLKTLNFNPIVDKDVINRHFSPLGAVWMESVKGTCRSFGNFSGDQPGIAKDRANHGDRDAVRDRVEVSGENERILFAERHKFFQDQRAALFFCFAAAMVKMGVDENKLFTAFFLNKYSIGANAGAGGLP